MKLPCKVIEDLLPMYHDKVCSAESAALVEEHLKDCPHCKQMLSDLHYDIAAPEKKVDDIAPLKKIRKSYRKMRLGWLIAALCVLVLIPIAFLIGHRQDTYTVEYSKEEAIAYANEFMTCLVEGDYAKAYSYWNIEEEKRDLLSGNRLKEEDLVNFAEDGLKKFCEGGEKLESMGGIASFKFMEISEPRYSNRYGTEDYFISYTVMFDGKEEGFGVSLTKDGIDHLSSGGGLIKHPLSHLTLWVQWVVDDYLGRYYDFDVGEWVKHDYND